MEQLIKALEEANKKMAEVLAEIKEINEELKKMEIVGNDRDNKNEDSNFESEQ